METIKLKIWLENSLDACAFEGGTNIVLHSEGTNNVLQFMGEAEPLCAENIGFKDFARSGRGN